MNVEKFIVANRTVSYLLSAMSIASAWIWAPALFVSAQVAYRWGLEGLLWFLIPNFLTLFLFAFFANKLRQKDGNGFTLSNYIKQRTSSKLQYFYMFELLLLAVCAIAVQLIAGGKLLENINPNIDYNIYVIILGLIPMCYTFFYGLRASVFMDALQYSLMFICLITITAFLWDCHYIDNISFTRIVNTSSTSIMLSFGIPTMIGLLSGAFGSQDFYQRAYATNKQNVIKAYVIGALLFIIIPIMISLLGFVAINEGFTITDTSLTNFETLDRLNIKWATSALAVVVLCGLISTIDSSQTSASAIFGYDISNKLFNVSSVWMSRFGIIFITIIGIIVANSGMSILQLFLTYGAIRSSVFGVSLMAVLSNRILNSDYILYSLITVIFGLVPINVYAILNKIEILQTCAAVLIVAIPGLVAYVTSKPIK